MIVCPPDFTAVQGDNACVLTPPEGPRAGEIRYSQRVQPLRSIRALAEEIRALTPDLRDAAVTAPELLITAEGEYAALVCLSGRRAGKPLLHHIGAVFADDSVAVLDALALTPSLFERFGQVARHLLYYDKLNLGVRRRRFLFDPPAGWQALVRGLESCFYPPDFPRNPATLIVPPAAPRDGSPNEVLSQLVERYKKKGVRIELAAEPEPVTSDYGLHGKAFCLYGREPGKPPLIRDVLVLADARYLYSLVLESTESAPRAALQGVLPQVARSVRPIPVPTLFAQDRPPTSQNHWIG